MTPKHQTQAIEKQAQAIREIREEMVSELNELEGIRMKQIYKVGMDIEFLGTVHRIHSITPYMPKVFPGEKWAIAHDPYGWGISLEPGQFIESEVY